MSSTSHFPSSALDNRLESINTFHQRTPRDSLGQMPQAPMWPEQQQQQQQQHPSLPWAQQHDSNPNRMRHMYSSAMTGPSLSQALSGANQGPGQQGMQILPPIFNPNLFAFNNAPQGPYKTVTSGLSLPEPARQLPTDNPLRNNLPLGEEPASGRENALGSLNSATGTSTAPNASQKALLQMSRDHVDVAVQIAPTSAAQTPGSPAANGAEYSRGRTMLKPGQDSEMRHVSSVESRDFHAEGVPPSPTGPDATSGPATRTRRRAAAGRPKYRDYFTEDASLTDCADEDEEDDLEGTDDDEFVSEISMRDTPRGMQSRNSSLQSADASLFRSSDMEGDDGRSTKRSAAAKKPRTKQLLCEQDPEAPGLTLEQRRKIRRRINNRASARRVRQKREEDLQKITNMVARLDEEKARLTARASQFQNSCMALAAQLKETRDRWQATCATNANLQRELLTLRSEFSQWQKTGFPQGAQVAQQAQVPQAPAGDPAGPGTPRAPEQAHSGRQGLIKDTSFDLGSYFAN